jgi:uncharacterized membrane protein
MDKNALVVICLILGAGDLFSQDTRQEPETAKAVVVDGGPIHVVVYEVVPIRPTDCVYTLNTLIFEVPVDEGYFRSVTVNQEVSTWFKTNGNTYLTGDINSIDLSNKWKLIVRGKKTMER